MKILLPIWRILRRKRGFTIIELLVASVILVILMGSITAVFLAANRSWTQTEARLQIYQNAREALDRMSRELATAFPSSIVGPLDDSSNHIPLRLDDSTYDSGNHDDDQLTFVAAYNVNPGSGEYDLAHLGYRLTLVPKLERYKKNFGSDDYLGNPYDGSTLANEPAQTWKEMTVHIISLNFRCYDGSDWNNSWTSAVLPKAIEITIKAQDKQQRYAPKTFQDKIYLPTSQ